MARPLRVEFPDACYHIVRRANSRFPVLGEERDRELLLERLVAYAETFRVRIRAYCVMANHFHGYVQTEEANLGRFMQSFLNSFTVNYNRRHHRRYKAFLVEEDHAYASQVSRCIHVKAAVAAEYGCDEQNLLRRHTRGNESRQVLLYLAATHCRGRYTLSEVGQELGPITVGALSRARGLMATRIAASETLKARVSAIEARLKAGKCKNKD